MNNNGLLVADANGGKEPVWKTIAGKHGKHHREHNDETRAVVEACRDELISLCPDVEGADEFGQCYMQNEGNISGDCTEAVTHAMSQFGLPRECDTVNDKVALDTKDFDSVSDECKTVLKERKPRHRPHHHGPPRLPKECVSDK